MPIPHLQVVAPRTAAATSPLTHVLIFGVLIRLSGIQIKYTHKEGKRRYVREEQSSSCRCYIRNDNLDKKDHAGKTNLEVSLSIVLSGVNPIKLPDTEQRRQRMPSLRLRKSQQLFPQRRIRWR